MNELPKGWARANIRDAVQDYETIDPKKTPDQSFFYVDIGAIDNSVQKITEPKEFLGKDAPSRARRVIAANDVLFSTVRTYLKNVAQVPESLDGQLTSTGISVLRANASTDPGYLFRWVCSSDFIAEISEAQDGTMYPAVRDEDVLNGPIPLPPLPEQRRIVRKLDTLSARTATARTHLSAIAKLVKRYRVQVLQSALSGAFTADWREKNPQPATSAEDILQECAQNRITVRRSKQPTRNLVDASEIPSTWGLKRAEDLCSVIVDGTHHTPEYIEEGVPFISVKDIRGGKVHFDDCKFISSDEHFELSKRCNPKAGDVLITKSGTIGRLAVLKDVPEFSLFVSVAMIRPASPNLDPDFLAFALENWVGSINVSAEITGSTIKNLHLQDIKALGVPVPSFEEQREIVTRIEAAMAKIDRLTAEAEKALKLSNRLDQRILAKAFAGELVPQDPTDEPASVLLDRIRAERASAPKPKRGRRKKADA